MQWKSTIIVLLYSILKHKHHFLYGIMDGKSSRKTNSHRLYFQYNSSFNFCNNFSNLFRIKFIIIHRCYIWLAMRHPCSTVSMWTQRLWKIHLCIVIECRLPFSIEVKSICAKSSLCRRAYFVLIDVVVNAISKWIDFLSNFSTSMRSFFCSVTHFIWIHPIRNGSHIVVVCTLSWM